MLAKHLVICHWYIGCDMTFFQAWLTPSELGEKQSNKRPTQRHHPKNNHGTKKTDKQKTWNIPAHLTLFQRLSWRTVTHWVNNRMASIVWPLVYRQGYRQADPSKQANELSKQNVQPLQYLEKLLKYLLFLTVIQEVTGLLLQWTGSEKPWRQEVPGFIYSLHNQIIKN